jgi:hypothetical protein
MSTIITRNSATSGSVPSSLVQGELAINVKDGRLFYGSGSGNVVKEFIASGSGGGTFNTGSFVTTSSFNAYTGSNTSQFAGTASYATNALSASFASTASYVKNAISASYAVTASYATYAANGGVTKILAGANVNLSPVNGLGDVTVTSFGTNLYNTATGSYGSFYDTGSVLATSATAVYSMSLSTTDISNGVFVSASNGDVTRVKFTNAGTYNLQFSSQFSNTDNTNQDIVIWVRKNGSDITDSSGVATVPPFKAGSNGQIIAGWNYYLSLSAGDFIQMCWHVEQANVITLETIPAGVGPTHPRTPSTILTATRVDTFLSNTGSFSGSFTGTLTGTASYATNALSASYAPDTTFPYTGSAGITGSLTVVGKTQSTQIGAGTSPSGSVPLDVKAQGALSTDLPLRVRNSADTLNILSLNGLGAIEVRSNAVSIARSQRLLIGGNNTDNAVDSTAYDEITMVGYNNLNVNFRATLLGSSNTCNVQGGSPAVLVGYGNTSSAGSGMIFGRSNTGQASLIVGASNSANGNGGIICVGNSNTISAANGYPTLPMVMLGSSVTIPNSITVNNCVFLSAGADGTDPYVTFKKNNISIGSLTPWTTNFDNNSTGTFYTKVGVAPTTMAAGTIAMYAASSSASNSKPYFRTENGTVVWLGDESRLYNVTSSIILNGTSSAPSLNTTAQVTTIVGSNTIYSIPTASYDGAWFEYTARSASNARAGQIMSIWSGSLVNFTETTTTDFGSTTGIAFTVIVSGSNLVLTGSCATAGWTIKTIVRSI